jgi:hypothetical protein
MDTERDWDWRDEAAADAAWEQRQEYAQDMYEERQQRRAHRCQCAGMEMPGSCPGPANCPMADHDEPDDEEARDA